MFARSKCEAVNGALRLLIQTQELADLGPADPGPTPKMHCTACRPIRLVSSHWYCSQLPVDTLYST